MKSHVTAFTILATLWAASATLSTSSAADATKAATIILPKVEFRQATVDEGIGFFVVKSRELDPEKIGVPIILSPAEKAKSTKVDLSLTNIPLADAVKYFAIAADLQMTADGEALILHPAGAALSTGSTAGATKASKIMLPKLEFRQATVDEGLEFLRKKSRDLDPDKSGVPIVLVASETAKNVRVDLNLMNVSIADAAKYLAIAAGLEMTRDGEAIVLRSR